MTKKVMIVDDEPNLCETVKLLLEGKGFEVVTALSGSEALQKLKKERVDLVLIDYFMPEMSGVGLANKIREDPRLKDLRLAFSRSPRSVKRVSRKCAGSKSWITFRSHSITWIWFEE